MESTSTSTSESTSQNQNDSGVISRKDLESLQIGLDRDFMNFWNIRRYGAHLGMEIKCPVCNELPPVKRWEKEDFVAYGYRKWKWLCSHIATEHCRNEALKNRRITAREHRLRVIGEKRSKRKVA